MKIGGEGVPVDGLYIGRQQHIPLVRGKRIPAKSLICRPKGANARGDGIDRFAGSVGVLYDGTSSIGPLEACIMLPIVHGSDAPDALFPEFSAVPNKLIAQKLRGKILCTQWRRCKQDEVTPQCPSAVKNVVHAFWWFLFALSKIRSPSRRRIIPPAELCLVACQICGKNPSKKNLKGDFVSQIQRPCVENWLRTTRRIWCSCRDWL